LHSLNRGITAVVLVIYYLEFIVAKITGRRIGVLVKGYVPYDNIT
jgi:hypothetical protein